MLPILVLGVTLLIGVLLILRWLVVTEPRTILRVARWAGIVLLGGAAIYFVVIGRFGMVLLPVAPLLLLLRGTVPRRRPSPAGPATSDGASDLRTDTLDLRLDHATGAVEGRVLRGRHRDRLVGELSLEDLREVLEECRSNDPPSVQVLEAYLDRRFGPHWRESEPSGAGSSGSLSREEAYDVLGLAPGATADEIKAAHRRLMRAHHPDRGGSDATAARLNEARDRLLED